MAEHAQEQLLGFLLDALEEDERRQIQEDLSRDPQLRQQLETLRAMLGSMEPTREPYEPPPGLARRTCRFIAAQTPESEHPHNLRPPINNNPGTKFSRRSKAQESLAEEKGEE